MKLVAQASNSQGEKKKGNLEIISSITTFCKFSSSLPLQLHLPVTDHILSKQEQRKHTAYQAEHTIDTANGIKGKLGWENFNTIGKMLILFTQGWVTFGWDQ